MPISEIGPTLPDQTKLQFSSASSRAFARIKKAS
jgi:hypothetical protein